MIIGDSLLCRMVLEFDFVLKRGIFSPPPMQDIPHSRTGNCSLHAIMRRKIELKVFWKMYTTKMATGTTKTLREKSVGLILNQRQTVERIGPLLEDVRGQGKSNKSNRSRRS